MTITATAAPLDDAQGLLTLDEFAARYYPGPSVSTADGGRVLRCPGCHDRSTGAMPEHFDQAVSCYFPSPNHLWVSCEYCADPIPTTFEGTTAEWRALVARVRPDATAGPAAAGAAARSGRGARSETATARDVLDMVRRDYELGRSTDGLLFAVPRYPGAVRVAREVRSLTGEITRRLHSGAGIVPGREAVGAALSTAAAYAEDSDPVPVGLRAVQVGDDRIVLDLADAGGHVVEVTARGWEVREADAGTPLFRRSAATAPLPMPERGGSLDELRDLLTLGADDPRWLLVRGWLVASLFSEAPRPILWATGPQGSGKSTRARMVMGLVEPGGALGREPGRNERDDTTSALGRFIPSWDNITTVSQPTSDWLCRLVTGVTVDSRTLYSDDDLRARSFRRTGVATSLSVPNGLGSDALERLVLVEFDRVPDAQRVSEGPMWTAWHAATPRMLGALLDEVAGVLAHLEDVRREPRTWPRMADYAQVLAALDRYAGLADDCGHLAAYTGTVNASLAGRAEDDPFSGAVVELLRARDGVFDGPAEGLLRALAPYAPEPGHGTWWPARARDLSHALTRASEELRHVGVSIDRRRSGSGRVLRLTLDEATSR